MRALVGGVDEAGRGCIVGPLVVAGVAAFPGSIKELREIGVRDSKKLSPKRREALYPEIRRICSTVSSVHIAPGEIDRVVRTGKKYRKLNYLEALYFAKVIDQLDATRVTVDASDTDPLRFRDNIRENMTAASKVLAVHKADRDFTVVAAASVIAKVERDRAVNELKEAYGDFGSGYPSDPATRVFFIEKMRKGEAAPDYTRKSWKTWRRFEQSILAPF